MTKTIVLTGKTPHDLDRKQWDWQSDNPKAVIRKTHPDELLPLKMISPRWGQKLPPAADRVWRRIEYDD
jgi:hypothetical protein